MTPCIVPFASIVAPDSNAPPVEVVQALFADHFKHRMGFSKASVARKAKWLSPDLLARLNAELARPANPDEVPDIDGDPFTDSQEYPTGFIVGKAIPEGKLVRVQVRLSGNGRIRTVVAILRNSPDGWQVDDLAYEHGKTLRSLLGK
jgi:hypothetical protein